MKGVLGPPLHFMAILWIVTMNYWVVHGTFLLLDVLEDWKEYCKTVLLQHVQRTGKNSWNFIFLDTYEFSVKQFHFAWTFLTSPEEKKKKIKAVLQQMYFTRKCSTRNTCQQTHSTWMLLARSLTQMVFAQQHSQSALPESTWRVQKQPSG